MTHRLTTNYAKNYCNRTLIVKVIVENALTCFLGGTQCVSQFDSSRRSGNIDKTRQSDVDNIRRANQSV